MSKTVQEIVRDYLEANGYDGLYDSNGCNCDKVDLAECVSNPMACLPGYKVPCDCLYNCDYHIGPDKATEGAE